MLWVLIVALLLVACIVACVLYLREIDRLEEEAREMEKVMKIEEKLKETYEAIKRGDM